MSARFSQQESILETMSTQSSDRSSGWSRKLSRRSFLIAGGALAAGSISYDLFRRCGPKRAVFIARNQRYDSGLQRTIRDGLLAIGIKPSSLLGKRVLLKPNLVEPLRTVLHRTTHPAVILAVAEVFRRWGAQVLVGEGSGHIRDSELALSESCLDEDLEQARVEFTDLNYDDVEWLENIGCASRLKGFYAPHAAMAAEVIISLPKLKTHHWIGMTAAMKNLYGILPGTMYGWPKNVLHHNGIPETVFDITASLPSSLAVVDAIDCMEGDGPIMGGLKRMGLLVIGKNLPAVDATCARIMGLNPARIDYLRLAAGRLGPVDDGHIDQRGERWQPLVSAFQTLDRPHLRRLRDNECQ
jgi:uncharacterized protein (DUF362 family)